MSFRSAKTEASLRLYSLPRRELQALCKQYGIPANKTNVKMADALSACIPAEHVKTKAWAGAGSLAVSKTTPMKLKVERKTGLPETSLASFLLNGKRKISPVKLSEKPALVADMKEASFPKPNTTPLKRGIKRTERPVQTLHEEKISAAPAFTRAAAAALHDRPGKSASAVSSPNPRTPTARKRTAEIAAVVTRRGGDALPPVAFSDLLSSPEKVPEIIQLDSSGKSAKKMKSRLGARTSPQDEETTLPVSRVSRGKRVAFADEVGFERSGSRKLKDSKPASDQGNQPEPEMETVEISYAEIEFKNTPLHRELLGVRRSNAMDEEQDVPREAEHSEDDASKSSVEAEFEFRDMALHKELLGSKSETSNQGYSHSPCDLQRAGTSANAIDSEASELGISNSPEVRDYSNTVLVQDHTVLSSIREDASAESEDRVEELDEQHLPQDLSALVDYMACDDLAEGFSEKGMDVPDVGDAHYPACSLEKLQNDSILTSQPMAISPSADIVQEEDMQQQQQQLDSHAIDTFVDDMIDNTLETDSFEVTLAVLDGQKVHTRPTPQSAEVRKSPQGLVTKSSSRVASAEEVIASASELVMPGPGSSKTPGTPLTKTQSSTDPPHATPLAKIQSNIDSTLAKATSILEKLAAWRADAEKKVKEGYWEPKFSSVVEHASPAAVLKTPTAKLAAVADKDFPSTKKARHTPKATLGSEKGLVVCEDADIGSESEASKTNTVRISDGSRDLSEGQDKENQSEKIMGDKNARKLGVVGKEKKKSKKFEVLKDRSKNVSEYTGVENALGTVKTGAGRPDYQDMSLRKLRAQVKEKVRQLETSKVSDVRTQRSWN